MLLAMLVDGRLHLTGIARLAPHLTRENRSELLRRATHQSRRQIEELIADIAPRPDAPALMRKLPVRKELAWPARTLGSEQVLRVRPQLCPDRVELEALTRGADRDQAFVAAAQGAPEANRQAPAAFQTQATVPAAHSSKPAVVEPLGNARYKVQFTASDQLRHKLERLRALMRPQVPDGDLAVIIERAVTEKLERLESRRFAKTSRPRTTLDGSDTSATSRRIPAAIRRAVYERDEGRCRYVDEAGRRCPRRDPLEYHHRHPFGMGGDHGPSNICLMCRAHNAYLATHDYGREAMARWSRSGKSAHAPALGANAQRPLAPTGASP
jgi:hypothetical protein